MSSCGAPFCGAPVQQIMLNMPKSASAYSPRLLKFHVKCFESGMLYANSNLIIIALYGITEANNPNI